MESLAATWKELSLVYLGLRGVVIPKVGAGEIESNSSSFFFFFFLFSSISISVDKRRGT